MGFLLSGCWRVLKQNPCVLNRTKPDKDRPIYPDGVPCSLSARDYRWCCVCGWTSATSD